MLYDDRPTFITSVVAPLIKSEPERTIVTLFAPANPVVSMKISFLSPLDAAGKVIDTALIDVLIPIT